MLNRSKIVSIGIGVTVLAGALLSFTYEDNGGKKKKYHVIHQKDGVLTEYDTVLAMTSSYTVENFLADKGIENEDVEIINVPSMIDNHFMFKGEGMEGEHQVIIEDFNHDIVIDGDGDSKEIKIMCEIGEDGKMVTKKWVNGEEVELSQEDLENIEKHKQMRGEHVIIEMDMDEHRDHEKKFSTKGEEGDNIEIMVKIDDEGNKIITKTVNGKEVEMTENELQKMESNHQMHRGHHGDEMMIHIDNSNMTEEEKEAMMEKLIEGMAQLKIEMDSLHAFMDIELETILEEVHGENSEFKVIIKSIEMDGDDVNWEARDGHHMRKMVHTDGEDFTIVIVSEDLSGTDTESIFRRERVNNEMQVFPNPNDGVFTIQFDQSEKLKTKIEIMDAEGKIVFEDILGKFSGAYRKEIDLKSYGPGIYLINVQQGKNVLKNKVIID